MITDTIRPMSAKGIHDVVFKLISNNDGKVLDGAEGQGYFSKKLTESGFEVYPVDIDPSQFGYNSLKCMEVDLNKTLPFQNNFFDLICSVETIEHLESPWHFIRELHRLLKPNGQLIITTPNVTNIFSRMLFLLRGRFVLFSKQDVLNKYHITPMPLWMLEGVLEKEGFIIEKAVCSKGYIPILKKYFRTANLLLGHVVIISARKI